MPVLYQLSYSVLEALTGLEPATIGLNVVPQAFMPDHSKPKKQIQKTSATREARRSHGRFPGWGIEPRHPDVVLQAFAPKLKTW